MILGFTAALVLMYSVKALDLEAASLPNLPSTRRPPACLTHWVCLARCLVTVE